MDERRKKMQGGVENFFKIFNAMKKYYPSLKMELNYNLYWDITVYLNEDQVIGYKGADMSMLFHNASLKLLDLYKELKNGMV